MTNDLTDAQEETKTKFNLMRDCLVSFCVLGGEMRARQKLFFKHRSMENLHRAIVAEKAFDESLSRIHKMLCLNVKEESRDDLLL